MRESSRQARRFLAVGCLAWLALANPACTHSGQWTILGYSTAPNHDNCIRTVRVPIFKNRTFRQGLEFDLTREVIRQIEQNTPYKVVEGDADSELLGTIVLANKQLLNRNQLNEVREAETVLAVELVWRDRNGEILSKPARRDEIGAPLLPQFAPLLPPQPGASVAPSYPASGAAEPGQPIDPNQPHPPDPVVVVQSQANFVPELGGSLSTAYQQNVRRLAIQIVNMMEKPW